MAELLDSFEAPCPKCARPIGDHTMREWAEHTDLGREVFFERLTEEVSVPNNVDPRTMCDHLDCRMFQFEHVLDVAGVEITWSAGVPMAPPRLVAKTCFVGRAEILRTAGGMLYQSFSVAADRTEKAMREGHT